jgi:small nuclear ribonucleoprotein (snRNP)-like protein
MFKTVLALTMVVSLACRTSITFAQQASSDAQIEKVKAKVVKIGVGEEARVEVRLRDGRKVKGYISEIENDYFTVVDDNAGVATRIDYSQVQKLSAHKLSSHKVGQIIITAAVLGFLFVFIPLYLHINKNKT